jgi:hypothetical protein
LFGDPKYCDQHPHSFKNRHWYSYPHGHGDIHADFYRYSNVNQYSEPDADSH